MLSIKFASRTSSVTEKETKPSRILEYKSSSKHKHFYHELSNKPWNCWQDIKCPLDRLLKRLHALL